MTNAIYDFTTAAQDFPAGTVAAGYHLTLTETTTGAVLIGTAALGQTEPVADVPPGTYTASIALVDATGVALSPAVVAAVAVVAPPAPTTVSLAVPVSLAAKV